MGIIVMKHGSFVTETALVIKNYGFRHRCSEDMLKMVVKMIQEVLQQRAKCKSLWHKSLNYLTKPKEYNTFDLDFFLHKTTSVNISKRFLETYTLLCEFTVLRRPWVTDSFDSWRIFTEAEAGLILILALVNLKHLNGLKIFPKEKLWWTSRCA